MWVRSIVKGSIPRDWVEVLDAVLGIDFGRGRNRHPAITAARPAPKRCTPYGAARLRSTPAVMGGDGKHIDYRNELDRRQILQVGGIANLVAAPDLTAMTGFGGIFRENPESFYSKSEKHLGRGISGMTNRHLRNRKVEASCRIARVGIRVVTLFVPQNERFHYAPVLCRRSNISVCRLTRIQRTSAEQTDRRRRRCRDGEDFPATPRAGGFHPGGR